MVYIPCVTSLAAPVLLIPHFLFMSSLTFFHLADPNPIMSTSPAMSTDEAAVVHFLIRNQKDDGKIKRGSLGDCAKEFNCSTKTIKRIWDRHLATVSPECPAGDVSLRRTNCGRKRKPLSDLANIENIAYNERGTQRSLSKATGIPRTTLRDRLKEGNIKTKNLKGLPHLTPEQNLLCIY